MSQYFSSYSENGKSSVKNNMSIKTASMKFIFICILLNYLPYRIIYVEIHIYQNPKLWWTLRGIRDSAVEYIRKIYVYIISVAACKIYMRVLHPLAGNYSLWTSLHGTDS